MEQERSELHSDHGGSSLDGKKSYMFSCPYLGTLEDADTSLSYPAPANHCFRTKSPASVELSHQETYCLTDMHPGCHVFHQTITASSATEKRKSPDRRKQRVSVYALPLVLILVFLAAIIWWPDPGASLQDAIAFGAQLQGDLGDASNVEDGVIVDEEPSQNEASVPAMDTSKVQAPGSESRQAASLTSTSEEELAGSALAVQEESAANSESAVAESQSEVAQAAATEVELAAEETDAAIQTETSPEEAPAAAAEESPLPDVSKASGTTAPSNVTDNPVVTQESVTTDVEAETEESAAAVEAAAEEAEEPLALIISDLPLISNQVPAQSTALDQPAAISPAGDRLALIGPVVSAPLALSEATNNVRALFVRQRPTIESDLLEIINRRQQAALLGRDSSSTWFKVRLETGVEGWVNAVESQAGVAPSSLPSVEDQVEAGATLPVSTITAFPVMRSAVVDAGALNLRSGPGVGYEPITIINKGELVGLLGRQGLGVWVRVRLNNGLEGWVNSSLLAPLS